MQIENGCTSSFRDGDVINVSFVLRYQYQTHVDHSTVGVAQILVEHETPRRSAARRRCSSHAPAIIEWCW
jgi:hypothetical protein